jgi:hypothetical protein
MNHMALITNLPQWCETYQFGPEVFTLAASHSEKGSFYSGSKELPGRRFPWGLGMLHGR